MAAPSSVTVHVIHLGLRNIKTDGAVTAVQTSTLTTDTDGLALSAVYDAYTFAPTDEGLSHFRSYRTHAHCFTLIEHMGRISHVCVTLRKSN